MVSNFRSAYDILVRPHGSVTPLERNQGLVRDNYLSGLFGGITLRQYRRISALPGVEVAAPVANIGYVIANSEATFDLRGIVDRDPVQLYRITYTTIAQDGTSRYPLWTDYVYYTRRHAFAPISGAGYNFGEVIPGRADPLPVCPNGLLNVNAPANPYWTNLASLECYSSKSPGVGSDYGFRPGQMRTSAQNFFPILLAAIDPVQEARLLHLDKTIVSGRYLRANDKPSLQSTGGDTYHRIVPVIASTRTYVGETVQARIAKLVTGKDAATALARAPLDFLRRQRGRIVATRDFGAQQLYDRMLNGVAKGWTRKTLSWSYWTSSPTQYRPYQRGHLVPRTVANPLSVWRSGITPGSAGSYTRVPPANADIQFRRLHARIGSPFFTPPPRQILKTPTMYFVGRYDPSRLRGFSPLSRVPLETYYPPELLPASRRSKRLLRGAPLRPTENIADYVAQPPLFLTTLDAMRPFLNSHFYAGANASAPISVIRVRVKGVVGPDSVSLARIRQVATEIHDRTKLQVDVTAGSSPRELLVDLPKGKFGRPALLLREGWSKKGVSLTFLHALDKKRLGLLTLILVSCIVFLANGAFAVVRERRREIGTLACIGWPVRSIYALVFAELVAIAVASGLVATGAAALIAHLLNLHLPVWQTLATLPLAVVLAIIAGAVPAWRAARAHPLDAVRAEVLAPRRSRPVSGQASLALANIRRTPARSGVAAGGLFLATSALTLLISINSAFRGDVVGTLLGNAISVRVRGLDFVAVGLVTALSALSLADVLVLNMRERAGEIVTLWAAGWTDGELARLVVWEALLLGSLGSVAGSLVGVVIALQLGVPLLTAATTAVAATVGCIGVALVASLIPAALIGRVATPAVLADE